MTEPTAGHRDVRRRRLVRALPWLVVGVVMVALAAVAVVRLFMSPEEPEEAVTVRDVADLAAEATESLDVASGVALLCDPPMDLYRMTVESTILRWQTRAGMQAPEVEATLSDVADGAAGSFVIAISSPEEALAAEGQDFRVFVESRDGRSCVVGVGGVKAERPTTRFSRGGYARVTSPPPAPQTERP